LTGVLIHEIMSIGTRGQMKRLQAVVSDEFHRVVKVEATKEGQTIREVVVALLRAWLKERNIEVD